MSLDPQFFDRVLKSTPKEAWDAVLGHAWETCAASFVSESAGGEITRREQIIADVDHFLATAGWDLWKSYEQTAPLASDRVIEWWHDRADGKAVLILDALSLRECPWLLSQAESRGFCLHEAHVAGAELPADTNSFAKALGFAQRSALSNNGAGGAHRLPGARTESTDISWQDCANLIGAEPNWVFWHHWPDSRLHYYDAPGRGLASLIKETEAHLTGDEFWHFVERLCVGRRVIITADHGYAAIV